MLRRPAPRYSGVSCSDEGGRNRFHSPSARALAFKVSTIFGVCHRSLPNARISSAYVATAGITSRSMKARTRPCQCRCVSESEKSIVSSFDAPAVP